jgi:ketosteroid isomerase-like protein
MFDREVEIANIKQRIKELLAAEKRKDVETALSYYADSLYNIPPGGEIMHGKDQFKPFLEAVVESPYTNTIEFVDFQFSEKGDLCYLVARYTLTLDEGEMDIPMRGKFLAVWRKKEEGWVLEAECFNGYE